MQVRRSNVKKITAPLTNKGSTTLGLKFGLHVRHRAGEVLCDDVVHFLVTIRASDVGGQSRGWTLTKLSKVGQC